MSNETWIPVTVNDELAIEVLLPAGTPPAAGSTQAFQSRAIVHSNADGERHYVFIREGFRFVMHMPINVNTQQDIITVNGEWSTVDTPSPWAGQPHVIASIPILAAMRRAM